MIHLNLSGKHKNQFYTLVQFYDNFPRLMEKTINLDIKIRKMVTINAMTQSGDLKFIQYKELREEINLVLRYLIDNYIFVMGLGGSRRFSKWFDIVETYLDITLRLISPNSNMQVSENYQYKKIELNNEDIYFLTYYIDTRTLEFYLKEHNIKTLELGEKQQNYIIQLLRNTSDFIVLPERSKHSKLAKLTNSILVLVTHTRFLDNQLCEIISLLEILIINILKLDGHSDYTWFNESPSYWIEALYSLVRNSHNKPILEVRTKELLEAILVHFYTSDTDNGQNMGLQLAMFEEGGLLINLANLLDFHLKQTIDDGVLIKFLNLIELYQHGNSKIYYNYIIELFPAMSTESKKRYEDNVLNNFGNLEIRYIRRSLENKIIIYDQVIEEMLITRCKAQIRNGLTDDDKQRFNDPLYVVLRLFEIDIIQDLDPYKNFIGHDDFFDFVCFPEDFDYNKFDTNWSTWLINGKYISRLNEKSFKILQFKYKNKMLNAPSENDKHIYYKYFFKTPS